MLAQPVADGGAGLRAAGSGRLTWFGIRAYDAQLWVAPGFRSSRFADHPFVLELQYLRAFTAEDIARRSVQEMERAGPLDVAEAQRWQARLQQALPDVQPGDRIAGIHKPGEGLAFRVNGRTGATIPDVRLAERFFGIWLAPTTSEPRLREALLATTSP